MRKLEGFVLFHIIYEDILKMCSQLLCVYRSVVKFESGKDSRFQYKKGLPQLKFVHSNKYKHLARINLLKE